MLKNLGVVQIRGNHISSTWKKWRGFGGKSLLQWVVRRATESQLLDGVIVIASESADRDEIAAMVPSDAPFFASQRTDALAQLTDALVHYQAENVVRICLEHPFIDPVMIDKMINLAKVEPKYDYIGFCTQGGAPAIEAEHGCFAELCKVKALRIADRDAKSPGDRDSVTRFLYTNPERFQVKLLPMPVGLDREDICFALKTEDSWDHLEDAFDALGEEPDWQNLSGYISSQPHLHKRMYSLGKKSGKKSELA